jgi:DNA-binding NarL/FixJ family response regulator
MTPEEIQNRLETDPDFVVLKRFGYSLEAVLERYPEGCPNRIVAQALSIPEETLPDYYAQVVEKLRILMGVPSSL